MYIYIINVYICLINAYNRVLCNMHNRDTVLNVLFVQSAKVDKVERNVLTMCFECDKIVSSKGQQQYFTLTETERKNNGKRKNTERKKN